MLEIFFLFVLQLGVDPVTPGFCRDAQKAAHGIDTRSAYREAERVWHDDQETLEQFYAFWENRDSCISDVR